MRKYLEGVCWAVALASGLFLFHVHEGVRAASRKAAEVSRAAAPVSSAADSVLGELRIPALRLSVPVVEGIDKADLLHGVGHIEGTAMPGGLGTVGLAGHRDTFLRPLAKIAPAMRIDLSQGDESYQYVVDSTEIVRPEAVRVLDTVNTPELVLVTCYPFHYIGAAPLRFIVHAHLVSLTPEAVSR